MMQIIITAAVTLIGGVLLFIFGEFARVLVVLPLQKYNEQVQLIRDRLDFYANRVTNYFSEKPDDEEWKLIQQISADFRSGATQLGSKYAGISWRKLLIKVRIIPKPEKIEEAYRYLMLLSNNLPRKGRDKVDSKHDPIMINHDAIEKVKAALHP